MLVEIYTNLLSSGDFNRDGIDHKALCWDFVCMMMKE
jgi:hypothetical protein